MRACSITMLGQRRHLEIKQIFLLKLSLLAQLWYAQSAALLLAQVFFKRRCLWEPKLISELEPLNPDRTNYAPLQKNSDRHMSHCMTLPNFRNVVQQKNFLHAVPVDNKKKVWALSREDRSHSAPETCSFGPMHVFHN